MLHGDLAGGVVAYAAGVFDGAPDGGSVDLDLADGKDVAGRFFLSPFKRGSGAFKDLGFGIAGTTGKQTGALPAYRSGGQVSLLTLVQGITADGTRNRLSPQLSFYSGRFGLMAEYAWSESWLKKASTETRARFSGEAWQATATFTLTGEKASYSGVRPSEAFEPGPGEVGRPRARGPCERARARGGGVPRGDRGPGEVHPEGLRLGRGRELVPEPQRQAGRRLRAHDLHRRGRGWHGPSGRERLLHPHPGFLLIVKGLAMNRTTTIRTTLVALALLALAAAPVPAQELLNVSYDPTRELYQEVNAAFAAQWKAKTGKDVTIQQSHGGSGKQARAVLDGLEADVVTLALAYDVDAIAQGGLIAPGWQKRLPQNSCPYTSTMVFLVRKGNPKGIKDWGDLARPGVSVITPNPKTSGAARWNYLAAWAWALRQPGGNEAKARAFVTQLYQERARSRHRRPRLDEHVRAARDRRRAPRLGERGVPGGEGARDGQVRDRGAEPQHPGRAPGRGRGQGRGQERHPRGGPGLPRVPVLGPRGRPSRRSTTIARATRPRMAKAPVKFPELKLVTIDDTFGGWANAQKTHFADGGTFDHVYSQ